MDSAPQKTIPWIPISKKWYEKKIVKYLFTFQFWPEKLDLSFWMSKNSVLYHFGIREQFKTSFDYKSMMSDLCLHFWIVSRILSPETHTSKKLELGSLMSKNYVLYHFGIRKRFRTSFVYITMMSELCLHFWLVLFLKLGYSVKSLSSHYS